MAATPEHLIPEMRRVLVTGASGYVGSRLVTTLLSQGFLVRVLVRDPAKIVGQPWYPNVEVAVGSATEHSEIYPALRDVHTAFYLLHSIGAGPRFDEVEQKMALTFGQASKDAQIKQIIYLGGIVSNGSNKASQHLASRANTGNCFGKIWGPRSSVARRNYHWVWIRFLRNDPTYDS